MTSFLRRVGMTIGACLLALPALAQNPASQPGGSATLDSVRARGQLACGVYGTVAGFSLLSGKGEMLGLDADICRAVAAAVFGDAKKVKFVPVSAVSRFTALQSGEIDLLARETTWTTTRESNFGLLFAGINFYDGTGFMLRFTPVLIDDLSTIQNALLSGQCDAYSTDRSGLAAFRSQQGDPADLLLLPGIISKEPDGPVVRKGDDKWFDTVRWTLFAQLTAEEVGISAGTADRMLASTRPEARRLLGTDGNVGKSLRLDNAWAFNVVKQVGNYGELYDRGIDPLAILRGLNSFWNKGGLQYAPPML